MKIVEISNLLADYSLMTKLRQRAKDLILSEAADKDALLDYSELEQESQNELNERISVDDFLNK